MLPFAVLASGGGATEVGLVATAQFVPFLLFGLLAGAVADRWDRRRIIVASDVVRLATQATAAALLLAGAATPAALGVLAAVFGIADAFFAPAVVGLVPQTLASPARLQDATALRSMTMSAGHVAGPALAGLLVATVGAGGALAFDALTFAVSVAFLLRMSTRAAERAQEASESLLAGLRGGWHAVRSRRWVWTFLLAMSGYHVLVLPAVFVLGPVLADQEYGGATDWALVVGLFGVGSVLGDALLVRWKPRFALRTSALLLLGASCQAAIIGSGLPIGAIGALELLAGICVTGFFVLWETSLQEHVPEHELSRVASYDFSVSTGLMPLGFALAGPASAAFGVHETLLGMTVLGLLSALALLSVRTVRDLPRAAPA